MACWSAAGLLAGFSAVLVGALAMDFAADFTTGLAVGFGVNFVEAFATGNNDFGAAALEV
jgi:hypothetical protein